jgi:hypothetical protein
MGSTGLKRILPNGKVIKYRKNPPRDANGKLIPTKKQVRARSTQSSRMKQAYKVMARMHREAGKPMPKPGTKAWGRAMANILKKNVDNDGTKHSHLLQRRAKYCRGGAKGKIGRCNNNLKK